MMTDDDRMTEETFQAVGAHLDALVQEFEALPYPDLKEKVFDLLQTVDALHREGLGRLIAFLRDHEHAALIDRAAEDPIIHTLLLLYDLVATDDLAEAVQAAASGSAALAGFIPLDQIGLIGRSAPRLPVFKGAAPGEEAGARGQGSGAREGAAAPHSDGRTATPPLTPGP